MYIHIHIVYMCIEYENKYVVLFLLNYALSIVYEYNKVTHYLNIYKYIHMHLYVRAYIYRRKIIK